MKTFKSITDVEQLRNLPFVLGANFSENNFSLLTTCGPLHGVQY